MRLAHRTLPSKLQQSNPVFLTYCNSYAIITFVVSATRPVSLPASSLPLDHPKIPLSPFFRYALTKLLSQIASLRDSYFIDRSHRVEQEIPAPYRTFVASNTATDSLARPLACSCSTSELEAEGQHCPR